MKRLNAFALEYVDPAERCDFTEFYDTWQDADDARSFATTQECNEGFTFRIVRGEFLSGIFYPDP